MTRDDRRSLRAPTDARSLLAWGRTLLAAGRPPAGWSPGQQAAVAVALEAAKFETVVRRLRAVR